MMRVCFSQAYIGVYFPLSHLFQRRLTAEVTALVVPSTAFIERYGEDFDLIFYVSAKQCIPDNEINGPAVYRKAKDVEYTIFLPFDVITRHADAPKHFLRFLIKGICDVFETLEIGTGRLLEKQELLIDEICSDPTMLEDPSRRGGQPETPGTAEFRAFFEKKSGAKADGDKR